MNDSQNKPTLEDLFVSKKLSNCQPDSWDDFEQKVKIKTLESYQKQNHTFYLRYYLALFALLLVPVFLLQHQFLTTEILPTHIPDVDNKVSVKVHKDKSKILTSDLDLSEVQFSYISYSSVPSQEYEMSFALENLSANGQASSFTTPSFVVEESADINSLTNFSF